MTSRSTVRQCVTCVGLASLALGAGCGSEDAPITSVVSDATPDLTTTETAADSPPADTAPDAVVSDAPSDGDTAEVAGDAPASDVADVAVEAAPTCAPKDETAFVAPTYVPAAGAHRALCSSLLFGPYFDACLASTATIASCKTFIDGLSTSSASCLACLTSSESASAYGPSVVRVVPTATTAGCVAQRDASGGLACAKSIQALEACAEDACKASCPITDDASATAYKACVRAASTGSCSALAAPAASCTAAEMTPDAGGSGCFNADPRVQFIGIATLFCNS